jgi:hypothetical protein
VFLASSYPLVSSLSLSRISLSPSYVYTVAQLDGAFEAATAQLVSACDEYISRAVPASIAALPIRVDVSVPSRNYVCRGVILQPVDTCGDLKQALLKQMCADGWKVCE